MKISIISLLLMNRRAPYAESAIWIIWPFFHFSLPIKTWFFMMSCRSRKKLIWNSNKRELRRFDYARHAIKLRKSVLCSSFFQGSKLIHLFLVSSLNHPVATLADKQVNPFVNDSKLFWIFSLAAECNEFGKESELRICHHFLIVTHDQQTSRHVGDS